MPKKQVPIPQPIRIQPTIDRDVIRLAKSKCAAQEVTLSFAIEQLLRKWVAGKVSLNGDDK